MNIRMHRMQHHYHTQNPACTKECPAGWKVPVEGSHIGVPAQARLHTLRSPRCDQNRHRQIRLNLDGQSVGIEQIEEGDSVCRIVR